MTSDLTDWNSFARKQAGERWRKQSAAMGRDLTELVVREAAVESGMQVLDVACGSGEPVISIAGQLNGGGSATGIDISAAPLAVAQERARQRGITNIHFQQADVQRLPFLDGSFDRITCRLGVMFFPDLPRTLTEIRRVLKRGGWFTAVAWGPLQQAYFERTIGTVRRLLPELEVPEGARSMFRFGDPEMLRAALLDAGFKQAESELRSVSWNWHGTPKELWEYFQAVTVPFAPFLRAIPQERKVEIDAAVESALAENYDGSVVAMQGQFTLAIAHS